jgi:hypothetical protein
MEINLDTVIQQHIDRHYKRFLNAYKKRIEKAKDKLYAIEQYEKRMKATTELRIELNEEYKDLIDELEDDYRLGVSVTISIKKLRKKQFNLHQYDKKDRSGIVETYIDDEGIEHDIEETEQRDEVQLLDKYSDDDIIWAFAEYKTCELFLKFLAFETSKYTQPTLDNISKKAVTPTIIEDIPKKVKPFSTHRQVLAIHYLMKYCQVKDIDQKVISRFIEFLTSKNESNIYDWVRNPLDGSPQKLKEDLTYVRKYFEELGMEEIVKMINNEIVQSY